MQLADALANKSTHDFDELRFVVHESNKDRNIVTLVHDTGKEGKIFIDMISYGKRKDLL